MRFPRPFLEETGFAPDRFAGELEARITELLSREHLIVRRRGEGQTRELDARPSIAALEAGTPEDPAALVAHLRFTVRATQRGYIHPAQPVNPRMLVRLGVDDSTYVLALARAVMPGGLVMIYNLCPALAAPGKPYIPWADGRCPFSRALLAGAGFTVIVFDRDDSQAARVMGHALGWDSGGAADGSGARPVRHVHVLAATRELVRPSRAAHAA